MLKLYQPFCTSSRVTCEVRMGGTLASAWPRTPCQHNEPFLLAYCLLVRDSSRIDGLGSRAVSYKPESQY